MKAIGHYIFTIFLAVGVCLSAYGFLSAYALKALRQDQLDAQQSQLRFLNRQRQELERKTTILKKASDFTERAHRMGLQPDAWTLYDVNLQEPLAFEAAQEIVYLCNDSSLAYYWPISLEIKAKDTEEGAKAVPKAIHEKLADVQLSVKGRFAARR